MAWGNLQSALIVLGVVILLFPVARNFVGDKMVEAADYAGLPLGKPRLGAFSATPELIGGETHMKFDASLGGSTENVELNIYEAYSKYPDAEPGQLYDNAVFSTGTGSGKPKLAELLKGRVLSPSPKCPADGDDGGCAEEIGGKPIEPYDKRPGWYKFTASLTPLAGKSKKSFDEKEALVGLYTEDYVELLDKPITGCNDDWGNCNVVKCKKGIINYNLAGGAAGGLSTWLGVRKGLVPEISADFKGQDFVKLFDKPLSPGCGDFSEGVVRLFKADTCTPQELDLLNIMVARARLLETAYFASGNTIDSEDKYIEQLDKLDSWKKTAVDYTMSCTKPLGKLITTDPKGAYSEVAKLGWYRIPKTGGFDEWEKKVNTELERVLREELSPAVANFRAEFSNDKSITLKWDALGEGNIAEYKIEQCWRKYARDKHFVSDAGGVEVDGEESSCFPVYSVPGDSKELSFVQSRSVPGMHNFTLKAVKKDGGVLVNELKSGLFGNNYVELYKGVNGYPNYNDKSKRGVITVCVRRPGATKPDNCDNDPGDGNLAECSNDCNVFEKKREQFKLTGVKAADEKWKVRNSVWQDWKAGKSTSCTYKEDPQKKAWELYACSAEEVAELYESLLRKVYVTEPWAGFYACLPEKTPEGWIIIWKQSPKKLDVDHEAVCKTKADLANRLGKQLGWEDYLSAVELTAVPNAKREIELSWKVISEGDVIKSYEVRRLLTLPATYDDGKLYYKAVTENLGSEKISNPAATSYTTPASQKPGLHVLELIAYDSSGTKVTAAVQTAGILDDRYVELNSYINEKFDMFSFLAVPGQSDNIAEAKSVWEASAVDKSKCMFEKVSWDMWGLKGCSREDLDILFVDKLKRKYPADWEKYYKCQAGFSGWSYCKEKESLKNSFIKDGWKYFAS